MTYDPDKLLLHCHVPKTAGTSLRAVLERWFPDRCAQKVCQLPEDRRGWLLTSHYDRSAGNDAADIDGQRITWLRHPFEQAVSFYFYWKHVNPEQRVSVRGADRSLSDHARNVEEFVRSDLFDWTLYLPSGPYPYCFDNFLFVGVVERMADCVCALSLVIGKDGHGHRELPMKVVSPRSEPVPAHLREWHRRNRPWQYELYEHVVQTWSPTWDCARKLRQRVNGSAVRSAGTSG